VPAELNGQPNTPPAELSVPTIHVPSAEVGAVAEVGEDNGAVNGDEAAAPKKKTRRGSRGGRGRKKKPVSQAGAAQTAVDAEPVDTPQPATEPAATDKKPTRRGSRGGRRRRKPAAAASGEATTAGGETAVAESGSDQV
jgi:hypothetical protein